MLAVWGLKLKLEAMLEVRFSGKGKAEWLGGRGEWGWFCGSWDGMMTEAVKLVGMTEFRTSCALSAMFCIVCVVSLDGGWKEESEGMPGGGGARY
jgi:hypothetical protein